MARVYCTKYVLFDRYFIIVFTWYYIFFFSSHSFRWNLPCAALFVRRWLAFSSLRYNISVFHCIVLSSFCTSAIIFRRFFLSFCFLFSNVSNQIKVNSVSCVAPHIFHPISWIRCCCCFHILWGPLIKHGKKLFILSGFDIVGSVLHWLGDEFFII